MDLTISESRYSDYKAALNSVLLLKGLFSHGDFVTAMKKRGYTLGVSQTILKELKDKGVLDHANGQYFIHKMDGMQEATEKLLKFFFEYGISVDELNK